MAGAQRDHRMFMIRQGCGVGISIRSGSHNEFLVDAMVTLLRRVATRAKAELSIERVDETKAEGDNSAWRALLRPWDLDTFLRVTRGDQTMVPEVSVACGVGVVCGLKHEVSPSSSRRTTHTSKFGRSPAATWTCLLYTSPSPRDATLSRMPSSA